MKPKHFLSALDTISNLHEDCSIIRTKIDGPYDAFLILRDDVQNTYLCDIVIHTGLNEDETDIELLNSGSILSMPLKANYNFDKDPYAEVDDSTEHARIYFDL
jgi:hypothetical protein